MKILDRLPWPVLLLPVVIAWVWVELSGYQGLNGQDAHDYLRIARAWTQWSTGGERPLMAEHPHGYPVAGALLGAVLGSELLGLRILSMVALLIMVATLRGLLRRAYPGTRWLDAFLIVAFVTAPFLLRYALVVMSDVPAISLLCIAFSCTVRWLVERRWTWLFMAVLAAVFALSVRLAAAPVVLLLLLAAAHCISGRRIWHWALALLAIGAVITLCMVPVHDLRSLIARSPLAEWSPLNLFRRELVSDDGTLRYAVPNIVYVFGVLVHPGFIPIGVLLVPFVRGADLSPVHARVALLVLIGYLLFIAGMPFQNDRVLLMAQPFAVVLLFPAFTRVMDFVVAKGIRPAWVMSGLLVLQGGLFVRATVPFIRQAQVERELADQVNAQHPQRVYTHGMGAAFGNLCPHVEVTELWYEEIDRFEPGAMIVVRPQNLSEQWTGLPPAINWQHAQVQGVDPVGEHPGGWVLVRVR